MREHRGAWGGVCASEASTQCDRLAHELERERHKLKQLHADKVVRLRLLADGAVIAGKGGDGQWPPAPLLRYFTEDDLRRIVRCRSRRRACSFGVDAAAAAIEMATLGSLDAQLAAGAAKLAHERQRRDDAALQCVHVRHALEARRLQLIRLQARLRALKVCCFGCLLCALVGVGL